MAILIYEAIKSILEAFQISVICSFRIRTRQVTAYIQLILNHIIFEMRARFETTFIETDMVVIVGYST
jgi:hypothetical protein